MLRRLAWLDLSNVQHRFATEALAAASSKEVSYISLEYRRFLLLRLAYRELHIPAPPLIDCFWRLHAADQEKFASDCDSLTPGIHISPDELAPPPQPPDRVAGPEIQELYKTTFPCGNAELWGWSQLEPGHRHSAPFLGSLHSRLPSAIDESTRIRLREEAFEQRRHAVESHSASSGVNKRGYVYGPVRLCHAMPGPTLDTLHWNGTIPRLIAEQTGAIVSPNGAGYLYYRSGDFTGIHTDSFGLDLVLLTLLSGSVEPLHCHLHLADTPLEEIKTLAEATNGLPKGGTPFKINEVPFLFSGQRIPHHRAPLDRENETVVVAQFYADLLPLHPEAFG